MSGLAEHANEYLRLRRALGHELAAAHRLLPRFVDYLESVGSSTITTEIALVWVRRPDADPASSVWPTRMSVVRGFARHMSGIDPATEVPPLGLVMSRQRWRPPYIYSPHDVEALMDEVHRLIPTPLQAATFETIIGLLAATGMRVGEAIGLRDCDIDWSDGVVVVRDSKFNKSREIPLHPTTVTALGSYVRTRARHVRPAKDSTLFVSSKGTPVIYTQFGVAFRKLLAQSGVGQDSAKPPRIHDLRHSFAVRTLARWYRAGENVGALLPKLSTYMGHIEPGYTYWYLSASPELLSLAADRLQTSQGVRG